jgi:hypothetical protein
LLNAEQAERRTNKMKLTVANQYFSDYLKNSLEIQKCNQNYSLPGRIGVRSKHIYTQSTGRHTCSFIQVTTNSILKLKVNHYEFYWGFSNFVYCHVPTISFLTLSIYYKVKNTRWSDEYRVHKIDPDIHLICELHVTVKLHRAACSLMLTHISYRTRGISVRAFSLKSVSINQNK